jgi:DNA repair protein RadC
MRSPKLSELRVSYCRSGARGRTSAPRVLTTPQAAEEYFRAIWDPGTMELLEEFVALYLNTGREVLGWVRHGQGGLDSATVDPRLLYGVALQTASSAVIVAHNHPSGGLTPSPEDVEFTKRLGDAGKLLGVSLLDHLILSREGSYSFAAHGTI